ncbi:hypothetical protein [Ancylobacter mangrovi]|uniref:hypothetical protein n=1 Tax=Ancylobacter mangrovi TaxID=2972472 RepID=UPI00216239E9|nr:hypothetical protein [Ancylobacter mangrovi]MCS0501406.1 hypothetical protein [Ancylobacter mangrovi]
MSPADLALIAELADGEPIFVRPLSPDFFDSVATPEGADFERDLEDLLASCREDRCMPLRFLDVLMVKKVGTEPLAHDEGGGDGFTALVDAFREGRHEEFKRHQAALGIDGPFTFRRPGHDFISFAPMPRMSGPP